MCDHNKVCIRIEGNVAFAICLQCGLEDSAEAKEFKPIFFTNT